MNKLNTEAMRVAVLAEKSFATLQRMVLGALAYAESLESELHTRVHTDCDECTAIKEENVRLKKQLRTDRMTGLGNRVAFEEDVIPELESFFAGDRSRANNYVVLICDLDDLKKINDDQGHLAGDDAIKSAAEILDKSVRGKGWMSHPLMHRLDADDNEETNQTIRMGDKADEYLILSRIDKEDPDFVIGKIMERINQNIEQINPSINISFGAAIASDFKCVEDVIAHADANMYKHKEQNR